VTGGVPKDHEQNLDKFELRIRVGAKNREATVLSRLTTRALQALFLCLVPLFEDICSSARTASLRISSVRLCHPNLLSPFPFTQCIGRTARSRRPRTPGTASLPTTLDHRAHHRLARQLSPPDCALGSLAHNLPAFFHIACFMIVLRRVNRIASTSLFASCRSASLASARV
jgi:hypothetical protein